VPAKCSESEFIDLVQKHGVAKTARLLCTGERNVHARRRSLEKLRGIVIKVNAPNSPTIHLRDHPARLTEALKDGIVLVGSDAHYWPNIVTTAHRAFVHFCKKLNPKIVVMNGDEFDGASVSRHPPIGWEDVPSVQMELETVAERLDEVLQASKNARHIWTLGNHDARFETRLATQASEYAKVHGFHLKDHIPGWSPCWAVWINDDVVIKHRWKGGIHATHNNTVGSGKTMVTGHLHSPKVTPWTDYNGTRWGVDCGTLAEPDGPQFMDYTEDNPKNWRSGFAVLTFKNGELLDPELVRVRDENSVVFRGEIIKV
jgi:hypothetical protein